MQTGHKRINSALNQPFSQTKLNQLGQINLKSTLGLGGITQSGAKKSESREIIKAPNVNKSRPGKGSVGYNSLPMKIEGDMMMKNNQRESSNNNSGMIIRKSQGTPNKYDNSNSGIGNFSGIRKLLNASPDIRSSTPNKSGNSSKGFSNFKPGGNNNLSGKIKKLDLASTGLLNNNTNKTMNKKTKSYYIPRTARDNLNLTNISKNSKLNDTNNSFLNSDLLNLNKTRLSQSKTTMSRNSNNRSTTPNFKTGVGKSKSNDRGNNLNLGDAKFSKSNSDLIKTFSKKLPLSMSKSPASTTSRISKKLQGITKINNSNNNLSNLSGISGVSNVSGITSNQNNFDVNLIKHFQDFKNNKNSTPHIYSSYIKKIQNNKLIQNVSTVKFGSQNMKRVITGNLVNVNNINNINMNNNSNNNTNDVSTNSSVKSKIDQLRDTNNSNTNNTNNTNNSVNANKDRDRNNFPLKYQEKDIKEKEKEDINNINNLNNRIARENKGEIDFRQISTSPLMLKVNIK
jgi:hypothetical protein